MLKYSLITTICCSKNSRQLCDYFFVEFVEVDYTCNKKNGVNFFHPVTEDEINN